MAPENKSNSILLYPFMALLALFMAFIGYNFGGVLGAIVGFAFTCVANFYALTIKQHE